MTVATAANLLSLASVTKWWQPCDTKPVGTGTMDFQSTVVNSSPLPVHRRSLGQQWMIGGWILGDG